MQPAFTDMDRIISAALEEDIGKGDATAHALIPATTQATLYFINREPLVSCGGEIVKRVFERVDSAIISHIHVHDGEQYPAGSQLISVSGNAASILTAERSALNLFQRMCSVATQTAKYVLAVKGTKAVILDTRKTMPGLRVLDKYAVRAGGGKNHRMRLDDAILIKDNHISMCGGIRPALEKAFAANPKNLPIEIECDTIAQVKEAIAAGAKRIMLDNMDIATLKEAVALAAGGKVKLEASGNVNLDTVRAIAQTGVDFISVGRLTHSVPNVDIGLDIVID